MQEKAGKVWYERKLEKLPGERLLSLSSRVMNFLNWLLISQTQPHSSYFSNSPAHARAHQAMGLDEDTVANLQPHVIVTELLKVVATWFTI